MTLIQRRAAVILAYAIALIGGIILIRIGLGALRLESASLNLVAGAIYGIGLTAIAGSLWIDLAEDDR